MSAVLALAPQAVAVSLGMVAVLALMNLRGVKESGTAFAIPTYGFVAVVLAMITLGAARAFAGDTPVAESSSYGIAPETQASGLIVLMLAMRAFALALADGLTEGCHCPADQRVRIWGDEFRRVDAARLGYATWS